MTEAFEFDVFISYCAVDAPTACELARKLQVNGLRVWLEEWEISQADRFIGQASKKTYQGLETSRAMILLLSESATSTEEWPALERQSAFFRDPVSAHRRFIPIRLDDTKVPEVLQHYAVIDWRGWSDEEYRDLLSVCRRPEPTKDDAGELQPGEILAGHRKPVRCVAATLDGHRAISGSDDMTLRVWDLDAGKCIAALPGHTGAIRGVALSSDGNWAVSCSDDQTVRVWNLESWECSAILKGHNGKVTCVAVTEDGRRAVSGSEDTAVRIWDLESGQCTTTLQGHLEAVSDVAITSNGLRIISASQDRTLRVWDLPAAQCTAIIESHTGGVNAVAITADGFLAVSGSEDGTVGVWDLLSKQCIGTLEGHTDRVEGVALVPDGRRAVSGSADHTARVWDLDVGSCAGVLRGHTDWVYVVAITADGQRVVSPSFDRTVRVWDLPPIAEGVAVAVDTTRYTNAKVVLLGETGVGKTGLALRLCENRWQPTESTHGMIVSKLELPPAEETPAIEREVWLWDLAGQPDYRLVHQLYMDETALGVFVFDPQDDNPFEHLGHWVKALDTATKHEPAKLLVAGRCDRGGITISRQRFERYIREQGFSGFIWTEAKTGEGCAELKEAIARHIPWQRLPWTATTLLFKSLKDAILELTEEDDAPLVRLPALRQRLQLMLPDRTVSKAGLRAVVGLMQGQGVVQALAFGDFVLLQPEWLNRYASVVVRTAREHSDEMGTVPEQDVLSGQLDYKGMKRLSETDEMILCRAMVQTFLDRALCLRESTPHGTMLIFPSYFRRDKPDLPEHPNVLVTYGFSGALDEIWATLIVRLNYSDVFKKDQLWKDAADFHTPEGRRVGLAMYRKAEGAAEMTVYFEAGVPDDTKVTFIKYVHEHLLAKAQPPEAVTRVRTYICPHCDEPLEAHRAIRIRLSKGLTDIRCPICEERLPLIDLIEEKFSSDEFLRRVRDLDEQARINLDNESRELILVGHATAIAAEAGQIFRPVAWADWGIDGEIEFKDNKGRASGRRVYLQLKSGDSYLYRRQRDDVDVFRIRNPRHAEYWLAQGQPVMLVIRTSDGKIRWMNITEYLQRKGSDHRHVVFDGEPFTMQAVLHLRDQLLR